MSYKVFHDFETYCTLDLTKVGAWKYSEAAEVICLSYAVEDGPVERWDLKNGEPKWLSDPQAELHAFNSFFEYCIWLNTVKVNPGPISRWHDTAARAAYNGLPSGLQKCCEALNLGRLGLAKDRRGGYLIGRLCKPVNGERLTDEKLVEELRSYCDQDVVAERAVHNWTRPLSAEERLVWELDQKINLFGINSDSVFIERAIKAVEAITEAGSTEMRRLTKGKVSSVNEAAKIKAFVTGCGYEILSIAKAPLREALEDQLLPPAAAEVLRIRQKSGRSSLAKFAKMKKTAGRDGRLRGTLAYYGAGTGRWAGRLIQPQNFPRPDKSINPLEVISWVGDLDWMLDLWEDPAEALVSSLRAALTASEGCRLIISDYSAIEARFLAWLADENSRLEIFRGDGKIYEAAAGRIFKVPVAQVTKEQRTIGKVAEIALGYGGGEKAFVKMAEVYGLRGFSEERAIEIKDLWRAANDKIVSYWQVLEDAAKKAMLNPGAKITAGKVSFKKAGGHLFCRLPSGRVLTYPYAFMGVNRWNGASVCYKSIHSLSHKWLATETYGGKLAENITQAGCRDIMSRAMLRLDKLGYRICLTVHDEIITDMPNGEGSLAEMNEVMCEIPKWATGLPLNTEGQEVFRYGK